MMHQRDLLLVPFPFSDQTGKKIRPVIVISNDNFNKNSEDVLVVAVTSNILKEKYSLLLSNKDLAEGKLFSECVIRCENILKIDKDIIIKKIGQINKDKLNSIRHIILQILE